jgi:DNA-directed RNA polymerase specialized sigma24 family protein
MPQEVDPIPESLIPALPIPPGAMAFTQRMHGMMDGQSKDDATVAKAFEGMDEMVDRIAAGLYNLASMLVGEGEEGIGLVETTIATAEVSVCQDPLLARKNSRRALCRAAIESIEQRQPGSLAAPLRVVPVATCLEDDDLESAGISREDLDHMIAGPERERVRKWLESLPVATRVVFILRAVAGFTAAETAGLLAERGGAQAAGWTPDAVRDLFRQGLCSLASQLIQATAAR